VDPQETPSILGDPIRTLVRLQVQTAANQEELTPLMAHQTEVLGEIRESNTGYAQVWNENGNTYFRRHTFESGGPKIQVTQENLNALAAGTWTDENSRAVSFDGATTLAGIPWSHGPCDKFVRYLKSTGQME
jgi:hypothetical protein